MSKRDECRAKFELSENNETASKDHGLVHQQRQGHKINLFMKRFPTCLIIADNVPSVLWLLDLSVTFSKIFVYVYDNGVLSDIVKTLWKEKIQIVNEKKVLKIIGDTRICKFGMGSVDSLWTLWEKSNVLVLGKTILVCPYNRLRAQQFAKVKVNWSRFHHAKLGGVTNSKWLIGIPRSCANETLMHIISNLGMKRSLLSIIDEGTLGKITGPPHVESKNVLWSITNPDKHFKCPSYRSSTGWVNRPLTFKERAIALDVNEIMINQLVEDPQTSTIRKLIEAGSLIPGKILQIGVSWMLEIWGCPVEQESVYLKNQKAIPLISGGDDQSMSEEDAEFLKAERNYLNQYGEKAAKNDDEAIPVELWDRSVLRGYFTWISYGPKVAKALEVIRNKFAFRWYVYRLRKSFMHYMSTQHGYKWWKYTGMNNNIWPSPVSKRKRFNALTKNLLPKLNKLDQLARDLEVGRDALRRAVNSSWWEWSSGSACFFWRWPAEIRTHVRDGVPIHVEKKLPRYKQRQVFHLNEQGMEQLGKKVQKVTDRGYLEEGFVGSLINYFAVPKGEGDIRVVYDGTKCGLNQSVWAPNFFLPSVDSLLMSVSASTWFSDMDLGEMFLNYYLDRKLRPFAGVDVSKFNKTGDTKTWLRWNRTLMGFKSSPYIACKLYGWTLDVIRGNPRHPKNPFAWSHIRLNLPGSELYDPELQWICKMNGSVEASDLKVYVDDVRPHGSTEKNCRKAGKKAAKVTQHLGQQDAGRKVRPPSQDPGPWCGSFVCVKDRSVFAFVSEKKWNKGRAYVRDWLKIVSQARDRKETAILEHKPLEQGRGFLVYLSRIYTSMVPYLKGIHLTLDSWRDGRDTDGWKLSSNARRKINLEDNQDGKNRFFNQENSKIFKAPKFVKAVPRLYEDLCALNYFFDRDIPPKRFVRGQKIFMARYGFGDASKAGFGSTFETPKGISFRYGTWNADGEGKSSNFRELENLASALEQEAMDGSFEGAEVFIFTDNSTAESAYFKGTSSSKLLFNIVLKLRKLEFSGSFKIHFIHVAGSRMISQGTDGLSRGDLSEGVMRGVRMLSFVPLHLTCFQRSDRLKGWITDWISPCLKTEESIEYLSENDWFYRAHDIIGGKENYDNIWMPTYKPGIYVWSPAPAAGQFAVEQLRAARNKRTNSIHIFVLPRLFTSIWRKQLNRVCDLLIELPFLDSIWDKKLQHEPLTLAFVFPFLDHSPWQLRRSRTFLELGRMLPSLWKETQIPTGFVLCKLLLRTRGLASMPGSMVRKMLCSAQQFRLLHNEARE